MPTQLPLRTEDDVENLDAAFVAVAHLWCWPVGGREEDSKMVESRLPIRAYATPRAVAVARDWFEDLLGDDAETKAGLDPEQWQILDVMGIEVSDAFGVLGNIDGNGVFKQKANTVMDLLGYKREKWRSSDDDLLRWRDEYRDAYEDDYTWRFGGGWGGSGSYSRRSIRPSVEGEIRDQISLYCTQHGHDDLMREEERDHA